MKKRTTKFWALVFAVAAPGMCAFSCSGTVVQEFRDAMIQGAASALETAAAEWLTNLIP